MAAVTRTVRIATRASLQARTQAEAVGRELERTAPGVRAELVFVETTGDQRQDVPLHSIGGQGVFVKEVQRAVLDGRADLAVHSAKDLPASAGLAAEGLVIGAFCARRSPADALVGARLADLAAGATVATGSVRRRAQLAEVRPDLQMVELRGNIQTRLAKIPPDGAIVMAVAALEILGLTEHIAEELDPTRFVPAIGQGCVAVEARAADVVAAELLAAIDHAPTRNAVTVERAFLAALGSGCSLPVGAWATPSGILHAFVGGAGRLVRRAVTLPAADAAAGAAELARAMQAEHDRG
jgi:hydroxymethylbilane synthase